MRHWHFILVLMGCCIALLASGCAHYQLGTEGKLTFQTLYIAEIHDSANVPQATGLFTARLRESFIQDGRVQLTQSPESADVTLSIDLRNYDRRIATVQQADTGLARSFDLDLEAVCTLVDNHSNKLLFEKRPITVTREIFTTPTPIQRDARGQPIFVSDQLQAEYQTMPLLAQSLADRVTHTVLDVW